MSNPARLRPDEDLCLSDAIAAEAEVVARAWQLVRAHPECFWFRHPDAEIVSIADVRLVVRHLREYGDRRAWKKAQELERCLSRPFSAVS